MGIKVSNNVFPHDPDDNWKEKLDRGGYNGTAQDLKNQIDQYVFPDDIVVKGTVSKTLDNFVSITALAFTCRIDQELYSNTEAYSTTILPAADGFRRIDILVFTKYSSIVKIQGTPGIESAQEPDTPDETIKIAFFNVFGSIISDPEVPPSVTFETRIALLENNKVDKAESSYNNLNLSGVIIDLDISTVNRSLNFTGSITELHSLVFPAGGVMPYDGIDIYVRNSQSEPFVIPHESGDITTENRFIYSFPDEQGLEVLPNQVIHFKLKHIGGTSRGKIEFVGLKGNVSDSGNFGVADFIVSVAGTQEFIMPYNTKAIIVTVNDENIPKTTANNTGRISRWSQSGNKVVLTKPTAVNNYVYIIYK